MLVRVIETLAVKERDKRVFWSISLFQFVCLSIYLDIAIIHHLLPLFAFSLPASYYKFSVLKQDFRFGWLIRTCPQMFLVNIAVVTQVYFT